VTFLLFSPTTFATDSQDPEEPMEKAPSGSYKEYQFLQSDNNNASIAFLL
jgi:hypothetical protein